jgi:hypothetical protein
MSALTVTTLACGGPEQLQPGETEGTEHQVVGHSTWEIRPVKRVDVLFVVDDSASMGEEQVLLANNWGAFVDVLENEESRADYRMAVVRTSGSACSQTPGVAVTTSCRARPQDFVIPEGREMHQADVFEYCEASCLHEDLGFLPTTTANDPEPKVRPWLQNVDINLRQDNTQVRLRDALPCLGMVGAAGCDYESPFEALMSFLDSTDDPESPNYGFIREDAFLYVLFISDEDDCTLQDPSILDPDGLRTFWPNESTGDRAPSAACFRAGVTCAEDGDAWACEAVDRTPDGSLTANPADASLFSLKQMKAYLQEFDEEKLAHYPRLLGPTVLLGLVGGVSTSGNLSWPKTGGPEGFIEEFGVGASCDTVLAPDLEPFDSAAAAPPTRLGTFVDDWTQRNRYSSCDDDYSVAFSPLADTLVGYLRPFCFTHRAALDPAPECAVTLQERYGDILVPECLKDANGYRLNEDTDYEPPEGSDICFALLYDADGSATEDPLDNMSHECLEQESNLEFKIARSVSNRIYEGRYVASCLLEIE